MKLFSLVALSSLFATSYAEISIDELVEQADIREGGVAARDLPRWDGARKIILRDLGIDAAAVTAALGDTEVILVNSAAEALAHIEGADALIGYCSADLIAAADALVWVQILSAGAERCLAVDAVANGGVLLTNMQKMSSPVIAEHAIAMMMALSRNLPKFAHRAGDAGRSGGESPRSGMTSIAGKKLLVAGLGGIGMEAARLGAALGMHVTGTRNSSREGPDFIDYVGLSDELHELAGSADVVINALPLTDSTENLFNADFFAALKPGAIFINVGRGRTVVTADLITALESGSVASAGLDVTEPEPLPANSPLRARDDVIITPHVAGAGGERVRHAVLLLENLQRYAAGDRLLNVVDPDKGY